MMSSISNHEDFLSPQHSEAVVLNSSEKFIGKNLFQSLL